MDQNTLKRLFRILSCALPVLMLLTQILYTAIGSQGLLSVGFWPALGLSMFLLVPLMLIAVLWLQWIKEMLLYFRFAGEKRDLLWVTCAAAAALAAVVLFLFTSSTVRPTLNSFLYAATLVALAAALILSLLYLREIKKYK